MDLTDDHRAAAPGSVHGGILATLADVSCAHAGRIARPGRGDAGHDDMHVRDPRQPRSGPLRASGRLVHGGRRLRRAECVVVDAEDRVLVRGTATSMMVPLDLA